MSPERPTRRQFGWVIAATLLGAFVGNAYSRDTPPVLDGRTRRERRLAELERVLSFTLLGAAVGLMLGLLADLAARHTTKTEAAILLLAATLLGLIFL